MIRYEYDDSGNRIKRDWYCWGEHIKARDLPDSAVGSAVRGGSLADLHMHAFPNPARERLTVEFDREAPIGTLELIDANGRSVLGQRGGGTRATLAVGQLERGAYWLVFRYGEERIITSVALGNNED